MALIVDGTEIKKTYKINYNGTSLNKIVCDGVTVWERLPVEKVYLSNLSASTYAKAVGSTVKVNNVVIRLGEALPTTLYYDFSMYLNDVFHARIWYGSINAGDVEEFITFDTPYTYDVLKTDKDDVWFNFVFYTVVNGEEILVDMGSYGAALQSEKLYAGETKTIWGNDSPADVYVPS